MVPGLPPIIAVAVAWGLGVLLDGAVTGWVLRRLNSALLRWRGRSDSSAAVFGRLTQAAVVVVAVGAALTVVFPSVKPVDLLGGLGVISIAAGIAFQTVLGNMFAGMVILARDRFRVGDQNRVGDHQNTVVSMRLSSTGLRSFDGRLLLIPNSTLHSNIVTVQTGYEEVRSSAAVDLDDTTDLDQAVRVATDAMIAEPKVLRDPAPQAFLTEFGTGSVRLELRFWSGARQLEAREAQHAVVAAVWAAFRQHGVRTASHLTVAEAGPTLTRALGGMAGPEDGRPHADARRTPLDR